MDPTQNTGSFGAATGGTDALRAAMERRGLDASILDQVSASSPTGPSEVPGQVPEANVMQSPSMEAVGQATGGQEPPVRSGEMGIALKALAQTVSTENTIAKSALKLQGI